MAQRRWQAGRVAHTGWGNVAFIFDCELGRERGIYFRLGRWRFYSTDDPAPRPAAAMARRLLRTV